MWFYQFVCDRLEFAFTVGDCGSECFGLLTVGYCIDEVIDFAFEFLFARSEDHYLVIGYLKPAYHLTGEPSYDVVNRTLLQNFLLEALQQLGFQFISTDCEPI